MYSVSFTINGKKQTKKGETILAALSKIKPVKTSQRVIVTVSNDTKESPKIGIAPLKMERMFVKQFDKELFAKRLSLLL